MYNVCVYIYISISVCSVIPMKTIRMMVENETVSAFSYAIGCIGKGKEERERERKRNAI